MARPSGQPPGPPSPAPYPRPHSSTWSCGAVGKAHLVLSQEIVGSSPTRTTHRGGTPVSNARGQGQHRAHRVRATSEREIPPTGLPGGAGSLALADADVAQQVERQASTLDVAGSIPVVRSRCRGTGRPDAACRRPRCAARPSRRPGSCSPGEGGSSRPWVLGASSTFRVGLLAGSTGFWSPAQTRVRFLHPERGARRDGAVGGR